MAACDLTLELDDPSKIYCEGEPISGQVVVRVQKDVHCKKLILSTGWSTHGRGNVAQGEAESSEVFSGHWQAGQEYRYTFSLATAQWPPTYYGTYLNVSHQVQARAKLSWAFDPKASIEFPVAPKSAPEDLAPTSNQAAGCSAGVVGWIIGGVLIAIVAVMAIFLLPFLFAILAVVWFFTSYLPKSVTGKVECQVDPLRLKAGEEIRGTMKFTPKRNSRINGIRYTVGCHEVCVSGSGSNRTTHRHELFSYSEPLHDAGQLEAGQEQNFQFTCRLPQDAAPSMDLSDNDLKWHVELRVDIPRWPDFKQQFDLIVEPGESSATWQADADSTPAPEPSWLDEVLEQLFSSADDPQRLTLVLEAIQAHVFDVSWQIESPTSRPIQAEHIHGGHWFTATDDIRELAVQVHFDDRFEAPAPHSTWQGKISIIGLIEEERVLIAMVAG